MVKVAPKYSPNDRVLCYHGIMLYDAKVLDISDKDGTPEYFVHYQRWNNRWDEWVRDDRLLEYNDENLKKQEDLAKKHSSKPGKIGGGGSATRGRPPAGGDASVTPKSSKLNATGGKTKSNAGSSGPSTPFDSSTKTGSSDATGGGLELESRASTPSVDGGASVASSAVSGSVKRKASGKQKGGPSSVQSKQDTTPESGEPKRKRGRQSAGSTSQSANQHVQSTGPGNGGSGISPEFGVESLDQFRGRQEILIKIPDDLRILLVDDWDLVTRQNKLCRIPATKSVDEILKEYIKEKQQQKTISGVKLNQIAEAAKGFGDYFNGTCGTRLLYKFERPQYNEILAKNQQQNDTPTTTDPNDGTSPQSAKGEFRLSLIYGFPHLLRLFVCIGQTLAYTDLDQKTIDLIVTWIQEFLKYLSKKKSTLFIIDDYDTAPPEYVRSAYSS